MLNIDPDRAVFGRPYPPKQSVAQAMMACLTTGTSAVAEEDDPKSDPKGPVFKELKTHSSRESFFRSLYGRRPRAFEHPTGTTHVAAARLSGSLACMDTRRHARRAIEGYEPMGANPVT